MVVMKNSYISLEICKLGWSCRRNTEKQQRLQHGSFTTLHRAGSYSHV